MTHAPRLLTAILALAPAIFAAQLPAQTIPHLEQHESRHALIVDGKPFFMLGAQINNSSSWPDVLPEVWPALADLHINTVEAPIYWEQLEPQPNAFDFSAVDLLVNGAREHNLHLVLLWFGTWKNGQNHYVPEWVKSDPNRFPREIDAYGKLLDVMSPNAPANLDADKHAFAALMRHVKEIDGDRHTVIMIQVENESGSVGSVRDFSPAAQRLFNAAVPAPVLKLTGTRPGTWSQAFGPEADERFAAYSTAIYINEVARAGKAEYPIPMYCNVWLTYPVPALETRNRPSPGQEYPSGGPQQQNVALWKAVAPAIDALAPDFYSDDFTLYQQVVATYERPDNAFFVPETGQGKNFSRYFFYAIGHGAIGFSPFGIDYTGWHRPAGKHDLSEALTGPYALIAPLSAQVAQLNFDGKLQTLVELPGQPRQTIAFGDIQAVASFGYPQRDGEFPPGTTDSHAAALVAQTGPMEFLVTGIDASVSFRFSDTFAAAHNQQLEILTAEEGTYDNNTWKPRRILNGDQTDRGLNFHPGSNVAVRIRLHALPARESK